MKLTGILAVDNKNGIGKDNTIPWYIAEDLKHFKQTTLNSPMIMGRKTFDSLPGILPHRPHIVITSDGSTIPEDKRVMVADSIKSALDMAKHWNVMNRATTEEAQAFVIGGANLLEQLYEQLDDFWVTTVAGEYDCDTFVDKKVIQAFTLMSAVRYRNEKGQYYEIAYRVNPFREVNRNTDFITKNAMVGIDVISRDGLKNTPKFPYVTGIDERIILGVQGGVEEACVKVLALIQQLNITTMGEVQTHNLFGKMTKEFQLGSVTVYDVIEGNVQRNLHIPIDNDLAINLNIFVHLR